MMRHYKMLDPKRWDSGFEPHYGIKTSYGIRGGCGSDQTIYALGTACGKWFWLRKGSDHVRVVLPASLL